MLQIIMRVNGQLIDFIDIINIRDEEEEGKKCPYLIRHGNKQTACLHYRSDGALVLAHKALGKIIKLEKVK